MLQAIQNTLDDIQKRVEALSMGGTGGGAGLQECPTSLEIEPRKTPWAGVFPLLGRLRRDASVEHLAGVSGALYGPCFVCTRTPTVLACAIRIICLCQCSLG